MDTTELSPEVRTARVVVGVTGSASSGAALRRAVYEARRSGHLLVAVHAWEPPGGEAVYRRAPTPSMLPVWERQAEQRLDAAIAQALGAVPADLHVEKLVVRAPAAYALNALADRSSDLLVLGAGPRRSIAAYARGTVRRKVVSTATAPVLLVAPLATPRTMRRELRHLKPEDFLRPAGSGHER
ncbi:MAG TPA: universal stress protein [Actinospica sp.]|jgi:nucleotide-binding universal stress UspA family protein|nr:universal stress protein [Actinospica sp.]